MDLKYIKDLIQILEKSGLTKMTIKEKNGLEITLEKGGSIHHEVVSHPQPKREIPQTAPLVAGPLSHESEIDPKQCIPSPMVGTFYNSPSPDQPIYVKEGDEVSEKSVVCIIEAMKVMNEVKAGRKGVVKKILVKDKQPVEYGQPLFLIE